MGQNYVKSRIARYVKSPSKQHDLSEATKTPPRPSTIFFFEELSDLTESSDTSSTDSCRRLALFSTGEPRRGLCAAEGGLAAAAARDAAVPRVAARDPCLRAGLSGLSLVLNTLRAVILNRCARPSVGQPTLCWPATRFEPACPMLGWTHPSSLTDRPLRVLVGRHLFRGSWRCSRWVSSSPIRQVEQIFR